MQSLWLDSYVLPRKLFPYQYHSTIPPYSFIHLLYLLTYSMVQSPSWEANRFAASQEIPHISRNPKVHYRTHKRPPPVSILGQPNPVHIPTSHLLEINPNIIHPSTPRSPQLSPSRRFPQQDTIHPPLLTHTHPRYIRLPTQTRNMQYLLRFNCNSGYTNILQCCVMLALYCAPVFFISSMMQMHPGFASINTHLIGRKYSQNKE